MMKKKIIIYLVLVGWTSMLSACSNDDDHGSEGPGDAVQKAFQAKYPGAVSVDWEKYGDYQQVEFSWKGNETDAWFYEDGTYLLSLSQIAYTSLPEVVTQAVKTGSYAGWLPDQEAQLAESAWEGKYYIVEVSKTGFGDRELYYTTEGLLHKEVVEDYDGDQLPLWMNNFMKVKYPQAVFLQGEKILDGMYTVYFLDTKRLATTWFYANQQWRYTSWPVLKSDVPAVVLDVLKGEAYQAFQIRSVEYRQTSSGDYYYFDLYREGSEDVKVKISPEGEIVLN